MSRSLHRACLICCVVLVATLPASAQTPLKTNLANLHLDAFPQVEAYLDVHNDFGWFAHGLEAGSVHVLEDGQLVDMMDFYEVRPGVQTVFVVNPGNPFAIRDSQGVSRYDKVVEALVTWADSRQGSTLDDLSVMLANGPEQTHFSASGQLVEALQTYQYDLRTATPGLDILFRAIDVAADATPRPGMEKAVLFITPPMGGDLAFGVQSIISRAKQQRVRIYVWLVASSLALNTPNATIMQTLASQTGGDFFAFTGVEVLPSPEVYLRNLRDIYHLQYLSQVTTGGTHQLEIDIDYNGETFRTPAEAFEIDIQPPEPVFLEPSLEIERKPVSQETALGDEQGEPLLEPQDYQFQVLIEFPDGRTRNLVHSKLYVDGVVVDENTAPPFEDFNWDIRSFMQSGQHLLQVEVQDSFGLTGRTIETPVQIMVLQPEVNAFTYFTQYLPVIALLAALFVGVLAGFILIVTGRIRPPGLPTPFQRAVQVARRRKPEGSGIDQAAESGTPTARGRLSQWINRLHWPQRNLQEEALAHFLPYVNHDGSGNIKPFPITGQEVTIGSDPNLAVFLLSDPSVEALHARLVQVEENGFKLIDEGSVAGTWVNFVAISSEGIALEHGDVVHIGRVGLRFAVSVPIAVRKPVVTRWEVAL